MTCRGQVATFLEGQQQQKSPMTHLLTGMFPFGLTSKQSFNQLKCKERNQLIGADQRLDILILH